ncbi:ImmA/IrrE family metallo-endopeptidase [Acidipropionibacterium jensenii]|uniref:ImmA/IrrE family metallo-endopeptidase n=1 Tax=Acidipropionibacterium jensenii TaxID=1749 RepID=UPI000BC33A50|nr:ImmA/IrrE family metallo-endopeptidase [Acidipropionibacterium jensenii]AZZ42311.1 ImmA/IrrE family metallo-endopeptidase [Acidipropionibacterium jensenii]
MALLKEVARDKAEDVLDEYWDGTFPVDPVRIAQTLGMTVYEATLPDGESGRIVKEPHEDAAIYLSRDDPPQRQNYTAAHELGHWFERAMNDDDDYSFVDHRADSQQKDAHEWFAEWFAAHLLMPAHDFIAAVDEGLSLARLTRKFGVSRAAARNRARLLGVTICD